jgi:hypothetical protein
MQNRSTSQMALNPIPTLLDEKRTKHLKTFAASVAMALVMAVGSGRAQAKDINYEGTFSGSVTATEIDTNTDFGRRITLAERGSDQQHYPDGLFALSASADNRERICSRPAGFHGIHEGLLGTKRSSGERDEVYV